MNETEEISQPSEILRDPEISTERAAYLSPEAPEAAVLDFIDDSVTAINNSTQNSSLESNATISEIENVNVNRKTRARGRFRKVNTANRNSSIKTC